MLSNKNQNWDNVIYLITYEIFHNRHGTHRKTIGKNVILTMLFLFQGQMFIAPNNFDTVGFMV